MTSAFAGLCRGLALVAALLLASTAQAQSPPPSLLARAWLLLDVASGATLASHEPALRLEPASLTKLMTAYVVFIALAERRIALDDKVNVSPAAFAAPGRSGARMFIEPGRPVTVQELLRGLIVVSGNDAAVALAEHASGNQAAFVDRMNAEARRLDLKDTDFANSTGLSDPQQYSSARDLARLALRLGADFPQHRDLFREREFTYNRITQANRNRLLWSDPSVDGMKTGHKPGLETLVFPGERNPIKLPADDPGLHLVQQIRDEAHRFAISGHRARRGKARTRSLLEQVPGIGARRRHRSCWRASGG